MTGASRLLGLIAETTKQLATDNEMPFVCMAAEADYGIQNL